MDTPLLEAIVKDVNPNIAVIDLERLHGYIEVLSAEPQFIQKIVKAYLENTEE